MSPIKQLLFACVIGILYSNPIGAQSKPLMNIVMIMADDVGYECFGCYGSQEYKTPRLDALAAAGIRFENCHSTPLCTPSRANLMSGKSNVFNYNNFGVYPKGEPTFANYFQEHGYFTAVAGKWQLKLNDKEGITPSEAGFDTHYLWNYPGTTQERYWNPSLIHDGNVLSFGKDDYGPKLVADFLIDFITQNKDEPFLVYWPMILPHNPFDPTPDSIDREEKDDKRNFVDMVQYVDKNVGRLEDTLIQLGLRERTLIVFTGDNGTNEMIQSDFNGVSVKGAKGRTRDHGTHVPLIVNLPGVVPQGQVNDDLICFSDFFATLVEAASLPEKAIEKGDGWSFWPQCLGKPGEKRDWIYGYYFPRPYARSFDDKYNHYEVRYARDKRYKLYDNGNMFDTIEDVVEQHPLEITGDLMPVHQKLQAVIDQYPSQGARIDYQRVKGVYSGGH